MDYEVFLLGRIKEEWERTGDNQTAVARGLQRTGAVITAAAAIMVAVFAAFTFARLTEVKKLGFSLAAAVLIDATLIRIILVPAAMQLSAAGTGGSRLAGPAVAPDRSGRVSWRSAAGWRSVSNWLSAVCPEAKGAGCCHPMWGRSPCGSRRRVIPVEDGNGDEGNEVLGDVLTLSYTAAPYAGTRPAEDQRGNLLSL